MSGPHSGDHPYRLGEPDPFLVLFYRVYRFVLKDARHLRRAKHVVRVVEVVVVVLARVRLPRIVQLAVVYCFAEVVEC